MNKKRKDKIKDIPYGLYCHGVVNGVHKKCPFYSHHMTNRGLNFQKESYQYCKFLHKYLSIQDQVKDCEVHMERKGRDRFDFSKVDPNFLEISRQFFESEAFQEFREKYGGIVQT